MNFLYWMALIETVDTSRCPVAGHVFLCFANNTDKDTADTSRACYGRDIVSNGFHTDVWNTSTHSWYLEDTQMTKDATTMLLIGSKLVVSQRLLQNGTQWLELQQGIGCKHASAEWKRSTYLCLLLLKTQLIPESFPVLKTIAHFRLYSLYSWPNPWRRSYKFDHH